MRGFTLVELIVVLAILGLMASISGLALASLQAPREAACVRALRTARARALTTGSAISVTVPTCTTVSDSVLHTPHRVLFLPDGRGLGSGVDPLTGLVRE